MRQYNCEWCRAVLLLQAFVSDQNGNVNGRLAEAQQTPCDATMVTNLEDFNYRARMFELKIRLLQHKSSCPLALTDYFKMIDEIDALVRDGDNADLRYHSHGD